ncbi:hypothetical protein HK104_006674 [Borealophlyctis nickersoniae]|nr:hypothetical protein HK104_006674 [Borealophlyctis nickersoniae]
MARGKEVENAGGGEAEKVDMLEKTATDGQKDDAQINVDRPEANEAEPVSAQMPPEERADQLSAEPEPNTKPSTPPTAPTPDVKPDVEPPKETDLEAQTESDDEPAITRSEDSKDVPLLMDEKAPDTMLQNDAPTLDVTAPLRVATAPAAEMETAVVEPEETRDVAEMERQESAVSQGEVEEGGGSDEPKEVESETAEPDDVRSPEPDRYQDEEAAQFGSAEGSRGDLSEGQEMSRKEEEETVITVVIVQERKDETTRVDDTEPRLVEEIEEVRDTEGEKEALAKPASPAMRDTEEEKKEVAKPESPEMRDREGEKKEVAKPQSPKVTDTEGEEDGAAKPKTPEATKNASPPSSPVEISRDSLMISFDEEANHVDSHPPTVETKNIQPYDEPKETARTSPYLLTAPDAERDP